MSTLYFFSDFNNRLRTAAGFIITRTPGLQTGVESRGVPWSPMESRGVLWSPAESWSPGVCCFPLGFLSFFIVETFSHYLSFSVALLFCKYLFNESYFAETKEKFLLNGDYVKLLDGLEISHPSYNCFHSIVLRNNPK